MNDLTLCIVNGPFQALSLVASLRQRGELGAAKCVVLLVDMEPESSLARAAATILAQNGLEAQYVLPKSAAPREWPALLAAIENSASIALAHAGMLFTYGLHRPIARYLAHLAQGARLVIYEEGLRTYVATEPSLRERARLRLAGMWGLVDADFGKAWSMPRLDRRDVEYCLLLERQLPRPESLRNARVERVRGDALRAALDALPRPTLQSVPEAKGVVIVAQYYARLKQMTRAGELDAYAAAAVQVVRRGQIPIFRRHPRDDDGQLSELRARCPELRDFSEFFDDPSLPLELYANFLGEHCAAAVSFSSSALYYLRYLYGIPTYTLVTESQLDRMNFPHRNACALAFQTLPGFLSGTAGGACSAAEPSR